MYRVTSKFDDDKIVENVISGQKLAEKYCYSDFTDEVFLEIVKLPEEIEINYIRQGKGWSDGDGLYPMEYIDYYAIANDGTEYYLGYGENH